MQKLKGVVWRRLAACVPVCGATHCVWPSVRGVRRAVHHKDAAQPLRRPNTTTTTAQPATSSSSSSSALTVAEVTPPAFAVVSPRSELAYRARLRHVRFDSLLELRQLPYSPDPLQILVDAMAYAKELHNSNNNMEVNAASEGNDKSVQTTDSTPSREVLRARLAHALAQRDDVRLLMQDGCARLHEAMQAADEMGDVTSMAEVQREAAALERFADFILHYETPSSSDISRSAESSWRLSSAVRAELLRGLLRLAREAGSAELAVTALEELLTLSERHARLTARHSGDSDANAEQIVSVDELPQLVQQALQAQLPPVQAEDHLCAMQSCTRAGHFDLASSLYRRLVQHAEAGTFLMQAADFTTALIALAKSCRRVSDFQALRELVIRSEATSVVPVSMPLYNALIDAVGRVHGELPERMSIALALYRRLRDGALKLNAETYAALMGCCAAVQEPTQAFAFYHEARACCRIDSFPPQLYTNLLQAYSNAGYGADARKTLDVLVEAGAPLTRSAFHAVLHSAVSLREAEEVLAMMTTQYHIAPTPHSYAYVVRAAGLEPAGVQTVLRLYDLHEAACKSLAAQHMPSSQDNAPAHKSGNDATRSGAHHSIDEMLLRYYPRYVRALEHALLRVRLDPDMDPRLRPYLTPLLRVVQQDMNRFVQLAPQVPTRLPERALTCVAVLAPDVLMRLDECVVPFLAHYSALVIPFSALAAMRRAHDREEDDDIKGSGSKEGGITMTSEESDGLTSDIPQQCHARLVRFLHEHRDVIHLVSLEDELCWSREFARYGAGVRDAYARCAALAMHLARDDINSKETASDGLSSAPYASQQALIVLVSTQFKRCGRYVVHLKRHYNTVTSNSAQAHRVARAMRRVVYHNPSTQPDWSPPTHSVAQLTGRQLSENTSNSNTPPTISSSTIRADCDALPSASARALYANLVREKDVQSDGAKRPVVKESKTKSKQVAEMDAAALMAALAEDN